tara:strand:+ start:240 stop:347 length:108 start_codon:yes stop_codon:yes gene_type:complete
MTMVMWFAVRPSSGSGAPSSAGATLASTALVAGAC